MFLIKKDWTISFSEIAEVSMVVFCLAFVVFLENVAILLLSFSTTSLLTFCKIAKLSFQMDAMGSLSDWSVPVSSLSAESAIYKVSFWKHAWVFWLLRSRKDFLAPKQLVFGVCSDAAWIVLQISLNKTSTFFFVTAEHSTKI